MRQKARLHQFRSTGSLADLERPIAAAIDRPPILSRTLRFDCGDVSEVGLAILHQVGLGAADSSNSTAIYYRVRGAGLGDGLILSGFDDSITAQMLANGTNGVLLLHQADGAGELSVVHAGVRSPAGKKFTQSLVKAFESAGLGIQSLGKSDVMIEL